MPIQIFQWATNPKQEFQDLAASGIIVLLVFLLSANALAIMLRNKYQKNEDKSNKAKGRIDKSPFIFYFGIYNVNVVPIPSSLSSVISPL